MASENLELEFWPIRQDRQVMNADIWASAHCRFPSENRNDLEDGAQQNSHCRLGSQLMLPILFRIKSKVPCGPKALSQPLLCFNHIGYLLFTHSKPTPTSSRPLHFLFSLPDTLLSRHSNDSFPPSIQISVQCQTLAEGLLWRCPAKPPSQLLSVPEPWLFFLIIICHSKLYVYFSVPSNWDVEIIRRGTLFCLLLYS